MIEAHPDTLHDFSPNIIADVYDTIFMPEKWHAIFDDIGRRTHCFSFLFGRVDYHGHVQILAKNNFDDGYLNLLTKSYTALEANPVMSLFDQCRVGSLFRISDHFPGERWSMLDVAHDVFIPQDMHFSLCTTVAKGSGHFAPLSILRSKRQGDFNDQELNLFQSLTTHMARALRAYEEIAALRQHRDALEDVLDLLGCGVVLLDAEGDVMFLNSAARALINRKHGLALEHRRLIATQEPDRSRLAVLVGRATAVEPSIREGGAITLSRRAGMTPLPCLAIPIGEHSGHHHFHKAPSALLLIGMPAIEGAIDDGPLASLYGLSERQAELTALLLEGHSLPKAAATMQISRNTAKTHMNRLLNKIGAANLGELDKLILNGPLGFLKPSRLSLARPTSSAASTSPRA